MKAKRLTNLGFTIVEVIVAIGIMTLVVLVAFGILSQAIQSSNFQTRRMNFFGDIFNYQGFNNRGGDTCNDRFLLTTTGNPALTLTPASLGSTFQLSKIVMTQPAPLTLQVSNNPKADYIIKSISLTPKLILEKNIFSGGVAHDKYFFEIKVVARIRGEAADTNYTFYGNTFVNQATGAIRKCLPKFDQGNPTAISDNALNGLNDFCTSLGLDFDEHTNTCPIRCRAGYYLRGIQNNRLVCSPYPTF